MNSSSSRLVLVAGLFALAVVWILLMGLVGFLFGGRSVAGGAPIDDGSVKAKITTLDRGKDFEIALALKVTDKADKVLEGLSEQEIEVYEDGQLVHGENFMPAGKGAVRLCLVLDASRSMNQAGKWQEAVRASRALLLMLHEHDRVGLFCFNDALFDKGLVERLKMEPLTRPHLLNVWDSIRDAIRPTSLAEGTPMLATMEKGLESLTKVSGRRVMLVLTDGLDTSDTAEIASLKPKLLAKCLELKVPLYMVSMAAGAQDKEIMDELASTTGGQYFAVDPARPQKLKEVFEDIGRSLQNVYTLTYVSPNPVEDGQTRHVTANIRNGLVGTQAKDTYSVPGVISTGGSKRGLGLGTIGLIFLALGALLGVLSFVPAMLRRPAGSAEEAVPAAAPSPPHAVPQAIPVPTAKPAASAAQAAKQLGAAIRSSKPQAKAPPSGDAPPPGPTPKLW
jgi:Mg-chelatase subunit ChlD